MSPQFLQVALKVIGLPYLPHRVVCGLTMLRGTRHNSKTYFVLHGQVCLQNTSTTLTLLLLNIFNNITAFWHEVPTSMRSIDGVKVIQGQIHRTMIQGSVDAMLRHSFIRRQTTVCSALSHQLVPSSLGKTVPTVQRKCLRFLPTSRC
jgi:HAMP domain-containing protein